MLRFMERFARLAQLSEKQILVAQYLTDTALLDCKLVRERPSRVAAVSVYAALSLFRGSSDQRSQEPLWSSALTKATGYKESDVSQMSQDLLYFVRRIAKS